MEYAARDQAQNAINTLSNQNLMGRLVYVREVSHALTLPKPHLLTLLDFQDRETEPRFTGPPGGSGGGRGGFDGGFGGRGGYGGGYGAGAHGGASGRQLYISNVCTPLIWFPADCEMHKLTHCTAPIHRWLAGPQGSFPSSR